MIYQRLASAPSNIAAEIPEAEVGVGFIADKFYRKIAFDVALRGRAEMTICRRDLTNENAARSILRETMFRAPFPVREGTRLYLEELSKVSFIISFVRPVRS